MIKPINVSPLNTTSDLYYECSECGEKGVMHITNRIINTDNEGNPKEELEEDCPKCNKPLNSEKKQINNN